MPATAYIVLDVSEPAQMVEMAEPFFMELNAKIDWTPVMTAADLRDGLSRLGSR